MVEQRPDISPEEGALILAHQLNAFVMRATRSEGQSETLSPQESEQLLNHYTNLRGILSEQGYGEKMDTLLADARELVDQRFLHQRSKALEKFGFNPIPEPDPAKVNDQISSFPGQWADVTRVVVNTGMLLEGQVQRELFGLADQILRP